MKSIRVITPDMQLIAEIDDYESLQFTSSHFGIGSFELRINTNKQDVDKLQKRNIIMLGSDTDKVGIIRTREIGFDDTGKQSEQWIITGSTMDVITNQRVTVPPEGATHDTHTGHGETIIKGLINNHMVNPADAARKIDILEIAPDLQRGLETTFSTRFENLDEVISQVAELTETGWKISINPDTGKWVADCYVGTDRTVNQAVNPPIVFSTDFETLQDASFSDSDLNLKNFIYVGGKGEGEERDIATAGENHTGLNRFEKFSDAKNVEENGSLQQQGESELLAFGSEISFEGTINNHSSFQYQKDWFLGDVVTVAHKGWDVLIHVRITEVKEVYEPSGYTIEVTFGKAKPTLISKLKSELKQLNAAVRV